jgi:hypothetical protein
MGRHFWYVYLLQSLSNAERHYVGLTNDLRARLRREAFLTETVSLTGTFAPPLSLVPSRGLLWPLAENGRGYLF